MFQQWQHKIYRRTSRIALVMLVLMTSSCIRPSAATVDSFAAFDAQVSTTWFELQLQLVEETPGFSPPVASRAFGYTGVALYEAIVPGMTGYQSLAGQLNELPVLPAIDPALEYDWPTVANAALAEITRQFFAILFERSCDLGLQPRRPKPQHEFGLCQIFWQTGCTQDELNERESHVVHRAGTQRARSRTQPTQRLAAVAEFGE